MPDTLSDYPYQELAFDKSAALVDPSQVGAVTAMAADCTDLVVFSHGWNNDENEARSLYRGLAAALRNQQNGSDTALIPDRTLALVGVLWPSKKFAQSDLIPGGAAGVDDGSGTLIAELKRHKGTFDSADADRALDSAAALVPQLPNSPQAREQYAQLLLSVVNPDASPGADDATAQLFGTDPGGLLEMLDDPSLTDPSTWDLGPGAGGGAVGGAAGLAGAAGPGLVGAGAGAGGAAGFFGLPKGLTGGMQLLNFLTYYQMKARAGLVGQTGLAPVLADLIGPRLHLVGHSFGARLVTSACAALPGARAASSMSLLQGAFSHYGFAQQWEPGHDGAFRPVLTQHLLAGPLLITHTRNDWAVGLAYALASRIANQAGAGIGDADSKFGGLGSNGAQKTPGALNETLLAANAGYQLGAGGVHNLLADAFIANHSDVTGPEVAHAVLAGVAAST